MTKFDKILKEAEDDLFKPASKEDIRGRKTHIKDLNAKRWQEYIKGTPANDADPDWVIGGEMLDEINSRAYSNRFAMWQANAVNAVKYALDKFMQDYNIPPKKMKELLEGYFEFDLGMPGDKVQDVFGELSTDPTDMIKLIIYLNKDTWLK